MKVIRAIEDNGGVVVCFENCTGMKPLAMVDEENPDVYDALARKYLNIGCSCMSPNKNRLDLLDELIDDFQVDGVVDLVLQACHTYNVETALIKKLVKDKKESRTQWLRQIIHRQILNRSIREWQLLLRCCKYKIW